MSEIPFAHLRDQGIDFVVFDVDAQMPTNEARSQLLASLTLRVRALGLKVDKSALAFAEFGQIKFYGTPDLVQYLSGCGVPSWTHTLRL